MNEATTISDSTEYASDRAMRIALGRYASGLKTLEVFVHPDDFIADARRLKARIEYPGDDATESFAIFVANEYIRIVPDSEVPRGWATTAKGALQTRHNAAASDYVFKAGASVSSGEWMPTTVSKGAIEIEIGRGKYLVELSSSAVVVHPADLEDLIVCLQTVQLMEKAASDVPDESIGNDRARTPGYPRGEGGE
ncbi:MAG TPA: hypothetical protein VGM39_08650 [Kofleriaceae bacterium]|jgi:hypothetical protein